MEYLKKDSDDIIRDILVLKDKLSKHMNRLTTKCDPLVSDAYEAFLLDKTRKSPVQIISGACADLQFLVNSFELFDALTQYIHVEKACDPSVKAICHLIKVLSGEEVIPLKVFEANQIELNDISARLSKNGILPAWLVSHGLASEQEI